MTKSLDDSVSYFSDKFEEFYDTGMTDKDILKSTITFANENGFEDKFIEDMLTNFGTICPYYKYGDFAWHNWDDELFEECEVVDLVKSLFDDWEYDECITFIQSFMSTLASMKDNRGIKIFLDIFNRFMEALSDPEGEGGQDEGLHIDRNSLITDLVPVLSNYSDYQPCISTLFDLVDHVFNSTLPDGYNDEGSYPNFLYLEGYDWENDTAPFRYIVPTISALGSMSQNIEDSIRQKVVDVLIKIVDISSEMENIYGVNMPLWPTSDLNKYEYDLVNSEIGIEIRCEAATALGEIGDERVKETLQNVMNNDSEDSEVTMMAEDALNYF